eukprot:scaffold3043_cov180-Amphora_coffeaeformis.AAC.9
MISLDIFELVLFLVEYAPYVVSVLAALWFLIPSNESRRRALIIGILPVSVVVMIVSTFVFSWGDAYAKGYKIFELPSLRAKLETYIESGVDNLHDILETDTYAPTFGVHEMSYLVTDLLRHTVFHSDTHNEENIDEGYNKGNDWFHSTLGDTMMYTCGIFPTGTETLEEAQNYKIDYVADALQLEPGHSVLDIGCGWSYLTKRLTEKHGANVTAVTLSKEQHKWGTKLNENNSATILLQDAMKIRERTDLPVEGFDRITSLEMAEHVGIRRYQEFLSIVHGLLKDDGVFYFQVAGLRRAWSFEDLAWGLFMGEHVFPGADASCPLGWVSTQVERAGFEIQRVHNMGSHYSRTLAKWLENWRGNKDYIVGKYGAVAYRRWEVFLAWSVRVARQGSSTLFMLTLTKAGVQDERRIGTQDHMAAKMVN